MLPAMLAVLILRLASGQAPSITMTVTTDAANSLEADIAINCPPDGFSDTFVVYFGVTSGGQPVNDGSVQLASKPTVCVGPASLTFIYASPGTYQVNNQELTNGAHAA